MEIERRFLIRDFPTGLLAGGRKEQLISAYIERTSQHKLRARRIGNKFFLTEKKGTGVAREETEEEISEDKFDSLCKSAIEIIKSTRYYVPYKDFTLEINVYEDSAKYPATVEVEFKSKEQAVNFMPLDWFGAEKHN